MMIPLVSTLRQTRALHARLVTVVGAGTVGVVVSAGAFSQTQPDAVPPPVIESWAPGAFDGACPPAGAPTARFRVDATVRLPLLIGSIPIAGRDDVGVGEFSVHDCRTSDTTSVRAYEFFAGSFPERARGLNRLGFLREATRIGRSGPEETAHFGVITVSREESVEEAERALDNGDNAQLYAFISGTIGPNGASNTVVRTPMSGRWTNASDLFRHVRPLWDAGPVAYSRTVVNAGRQHYDSPVGFLGAIQISLREAISAIGRRRRAGGDPAAYVHNGRVYRLIITGGGLDNNRRADYEAEGLVGPAAQVWRVEYRIVNEQRREVETFRVWIELPPARGSDALASPIVPLGFEFRPRSFLELRAVRLKSSPVR